MKLPRRQFLNLAACAAALLTVSRIARAEAYPTRLVRLVSPAVAGGAADIFARLAGQALSERVGQPIVIENRPGAGGNLGAEAVVHAPSDGYTLLFVGVWNAIGATLHDKLNYNFVRDIAPVAGVASLPNVIQVTPSFPARTVPQLIAYAKSNPGKITMASSGIGGPAHMFGELFKMMAGIDMLHVPYRAEAPAITDLLSGQVQVYFGSLAGSIEHFKTGRLHALAVTTTTRSEALPDVPPVSDFVPGYEATNWNGIGAPRGTPPEVIAKLNREVNAALADPKLRARFADLGSVPLAGSPDDFSKFIADETERWAKVIRTANIKAE
jgi:tripartite-type tricarboxylate transporter receptor subunit TctC